MAVKLFETIETTKAERFLDSFTPHHPSPLWSRADDDSWIFRGVRNAEWALEPSAFRTEDNGNPTFTKFNPGQICEPPYRTVREQLGNEQRAVLDFAGRVSDAGFEVPGDRPELRDRDMAKLIPHRFDGCDFPPLHVRWFYALAQHYGVPTRLLDWSASPLVAAYFAAEGAARRVKQDSAQVGEKLAVWALSRKFAETEARHWNPGPVIITVPTYSNPNLHAQRGLFTLVRYKQGTNSRRVLPQPPSLDQLFKTPPRQRARRRAMGLPRGVPFLYKVTLSLSEAPALLHFLHRSGIDRPTLFPGLHSIVEAMLEDTMTSRRAPEPRCHSP